jgi:SPP1 gp7 family putative phage head morphogenesis protein
VADKKKFRFDGELPDAVKAAKKRAAAMVTEVTAETQRAIRNAIALAIKNGTPPLQAAKEIRELIGLTSAQAQAVLKFRETMKKQGLTQAKIDAAAEKYSNRLLKERAERIARTEIMDALNAGQQAAWEQAQAEGLLSANATKEWIVTPDDLLCPECEPMEGQRVPLDEEFPDGDPPLHPSCRCTMGIGAP